LPTQLLIDMPAEAGTRLLTLSLLEQLSLYTTGTAGPGNAGNLARTHAYRATVNRVRGSIALYADALGQSVPRKARRHLRAMSRCVNELQRCDVQLGWIAAAARARSSTNGNGVAGHEQMVDEARPLSQANLAAAWLGERLARQRARAELALKQLQDDSRPFRRLTKRLGAYTTAVRLDDSAPSLSFGQLTGRQLTTTARALRATLAELATGADVPETTRLRQLMDRVVYLLEPVSAASSVRHVLDRAHELRHTLDRLEDAVAIADALTDGGRRVGAMHMRNRLRAALLPSASHVPVDEIAPGLVALAEMLREELARSVDAFRAEWLTPEIETFTASLGYVAGAMSEA
jgi:hypothetical protein